MKGQTIQRILTIAIFACIIFILFSEQIVKQQIAICLLNAAFFPFSVYGIVGPGMLVKS